MCALRGSRRPVEDIPRTCLEAPDQKSQSQFCFWFPPVTLVKWQHASFPICARPQFLGLLWRLSSVRLLWEEKENVFLAVAQLSLWKSPGLLNRNATIGFCSTATMFNRRDPKNTFKQKKNERLLGIFFSQRLECCCWELVLCLALQDDLERLQTPFSCIKDWDWESKETRLRRQNAVRKYETGTINEM